MLDKTIFSTLCNDVGKELALQLLGVYVTESRKQINELANSDNLDSIQHLAHSLKSSSRSYGALLLAQTCELIEMTTKHHDIKLSELAPLIEKATVQAEQAFSDAIALIAAK
ncbi:Hpt domain-containing protein [Pseudoalteromonas sp. S16_S37]|uniref:Hpt domain-containing protein n=1 Tax=Pseudoalteromonas sp. S16_S37 TaxID=2720228 RepID=UPI0016819949|nr:Hpt domain-containing protein [Pseudoalteromonas sp. S16_S37]MBD1582159.1 Hpt domain-containing protein [Pseudoalteromonas sp. S16_S37]